VKLGPATHVGVDVGWSDGSFVGEGDESDVCGFAEGVLVGLTAVGFVDVGLSVTGWVDGFLVGINDVGRDVGFAVGTAVDGLDDGPAVDGTDESFDVGAEVVEHGGSTKQEKGLILL